MALALIVTQLVVRGWLALTGNFYWDDLVLIGRASSHPILSWDYLGHSHDGHFMPAAFLVAGVTTLIAPVQWILPALTLIVGQALASLAVWRMIRIIAPRAGAAALAALAFYLFTPMTVPAFAWWAAALNTLPMQAAMAWIVGDAVLLVRRRAAGEHSGPSYRTIVIRSSVIFVVALAFFEKSLFILPVAAVAAVLAARYTEAAETAPVRNDDPARALTDSALVRAFTAARGLWAVLGVLFILWTLVFFSVSDATAGMHSAAQTARLVLRSIDHALIPSLIGGPWTWDRWIPSPPMGFPSVWMMVAGWVVLVALVVWAIMRRRGSAVVVIAVALYAVAAQIPVMWNRSSANTALELAQTMRYLPDTALVITVGIALIVGAPRRATGSRHSVSEASWAPVAATLVGALAVVSSVISLVSFADSWRDDPTADYLANARQALADNRDHTMLDQALPLEVLLPVAYPNNQISHVFGRLRDRPRFGNTTDRLMVLDTAGRMVPGAVTPARTIRAGKGACDRPEVTGATRLNLDGPLLHWRWTIALAYCADRPGEVQIGLDGGAPVRAPVQAGLHVVYVQAEGQGTTVSLRPLTPGLSLHTGEGRVGEVADARLVG